MAVIFYIIGYIGVAIGLAWTTFVMLAPSYDGLQYGAVVLGRIIAITPGLSVVGASLLFLAIGGVLSRLDRLVRAAETSPNLAPRRVGTEPAFD